MIQSVARQPELRGELQGIQWLGFALTEAVVFYGLLGWILALRPGLGGSMLASNPLIQVTPGLMIWTIVCFADHVLRAEDATRSGPIQKMIDERRERIRAVDRRGRQRARARRAACSRSTAS